LIPIAESDRLEKHKRQKKKEALQKRIAKRGKTAVPARAKRQTYIASLYLQTCERLESQIK